MMPPYRYLLLLWFVLINAVAYAQSQDVEFYPTNQFLTGKSILKVKRDFRDPYLWVLANNNEVYRINSLTMVVDDYTPQFAKYKNFRFIDIAGTNQDTVFVATNTSNVIEFKKGAINVIGASEGLTDDVTSIGISNFGGDVTFGALLIGTTKGLGQYDVVAEQLTYFQFYHLSDIQVYEASYRNLTRTENNYEYYLPSFIPLSNYGYDGSAIFEIEPNSQSGNNVLTAFGTLPYLVSPNDNFFESNIFWGNEKGLFEAKAVDINGPGLYNYKLQGIKVNKVTDILGMTSLDDPYNNPSSSLIKDNLLVGTDKGLYFSSSLYGQFNNNSLHVYSMFHYDELGFEHINDICVNGTAQTYDDTPQGCENGVWIAADNGLYLIKPDYANFFDPKTRLQAVKCSNLTYIDTSSTVQVCAGDSARFYFNGNVAAGKNLQWMKDGVALPNKTNLDLSVVIPGEYYAVVYSPCENLHVETNHFNVKTISAPTFSFNYPNVLQNCDGSAVNLSVDNKSNYHYRWYTNGVLNNDTTYNYLVTGSGKYKVEVSACTNSWIPSKEIEVDLINLPGATVSPDKASYCAGESATLTIDIPADARYVINWYNNGNILASEKNKTSIKATDDGHYSVMLKSTIANCSSVSNTFDLSFIPAPSFNFNYPDEMQYCSGTPASLIVTGSNSYLYRWYKNGILNGNNTNLQAVSESGTYKVEVSSCGNSWISSKETQVTLLDIPLPVIKTDKSFYCIGDNATMSITAPINPVYTINWYYNNSLLPSSTNETSLITNVEGNYKVEIISNSANTDGSVCNQTSALQTINFVPVPTLSIEQKVNTNLCDGQSVELKAIFNNGNVKWTTGENSDAITINTSGLYGATLTTAAGCTANAKTSVNFFPNPTLDLPNAMVCASSLERTQLIAPSGMASYTWNGVPGSNIYTADHAQTVTLIVKDQNGCQASQDIIVTDQCADLSIPNTFTPNGDGVNDKWEIKDIAYDSSAEVSIYTRYGQQVYKSKGYGTAWDGTTNGKRLPAAVYYYVIKVKNNTKIYSGSITIIL